MPRHAMARHGMAWHGMAHHAMARHGTAWHGTARAGRSSDTAISSVTSNFLGTAFTIGDNGLNPELVDNV